MNTMKNMFDEYNEKYAILSNLQLNSSSNADRANTNF